MIDIPTIPPSIMLFGTRKTSKAKAAINGPSVRKNIFLSIAQNISFFVSFLSGILHLVFLSGSFYCHKVVDFENCFILFFNFFFVAQNCF